MECLNADKTDFDEKKLTKKMVKYFKIRKNQYFTALPMLETFSRALNRANLGLKGVRQNDEYYPQMNEDLILLQTKLNIPNDKMAELNNLKDLSYGLINLSIGMQLVNEDRSWYDRQPNYIKDRVEDVFKLNDRYTEASSAVKRNIKKAMLADSNI